jgi:hypothetical protein
MSGKSGGRKMPVNSFNRVTTSMQQVQLLPQVCENHEVQLCPFLPHTATNILSHTCPSEPTLHAVPSLTPTSSTVRPTTAQQGPTYTVMTQEARNFQAANSHKNLQCHGSSVPPVSRERNFLHTLPRARQFKVLNRKQLTRKQRAIGVTSNYLRISSSATHAMSESFSFVLRTKRLTVIAM